MPIPSTAPATFEELADELRRRERDLSPSHRKLAERVLSDPEAVAFMKVSELAAAASVNEATVVRFAAGLGLKGFPALTRLCQEKLQEQAQLLRRFDNLEQLAATGSGVIEQAVALDQANIARTFARIEDSTWDSAIEKLARAPRVHVMGMRKAHAPAYLLGYLLGIVREEVEIVTAAAGSLPESLRRVRAGDTFVAMSIHRYCADTVRAARWAQKQGAHVIACTDNAGSPLVATAEDIFYVDAASASVLRSMTAFTSLAQAMSGAVAQLLGQQVRQSLSGEEELLRTFGVYEIDPLGRNRTAEDS